MLGLTYCEDLYNADISIHISDFESEIYTESIAIQPDIIHKGIPEDYIQGILDSVKKNQNLLKGGKYSFCVGAHGEVGSSEKIFYILTSLLLKLLDKDISDMCVIEKYISDELM